MLARMDQPERDTPFRLPLVFRRETRWGHNFRRTEPFELKHLRVIFELEYVAVRCIDPPIHDRQRDFSTGLNGPTHLGE